MNHYPRHVGDYLRKTIGLTLAQDGAYNRMIDLYYSEEKPLSLDKAILYADLRCRNKSDRDVVDSVLARYFRKAADGYRNDRCDTEIAKFYDKSAKAKAAGTISGAVRRSTKKERTFNGRSTDAEHEHTLHVEPASNQEPVTIKPKSTAMSSSAETHPPNCDVDSPPNLKTERREQARQIIGFLNEKTGRNFRMVDANLSPIMARMKEGATVRDLRAVVARKCRDWSADEKMEQYLRPETLFNATKFAQYVGEVPPQPQQG